MKKTHNFLQFISARIVAHWVNCNSHTDSHLDCASLLNLHVCVLSAQIFFMCVYGHQVYCRLSLSSLWWPESTSRVVCDGVGCSELMRAAYALVYVYAVAWLALYCYIGLPIDWSCWCVYNIQMIIFCASLYISTPVSSASHWLPLFMYSEASNYLIFIGFSLPWFNVTLLFNTLRSIYLWCGTFSCYIRYSLYTCWPILGPMYSCDLMIWWQHIHIWELESLFSFSTFVATRTTKCTYKLSML